MTKLEYQEYAMCSQNRYAQAGARAVGISIEIARQKANAQFEELLPDGLQTQNQHLYAIIKDDKLPIGIMWFAQVSSDGCNEEFLYDIEIEAEYRGQGLGKKAMELFEAKARELKLDTLGLHVFYDNEVACALYKKIGYAEIKSGKGSMVMRKKLK